MLVTCPECGARYEIDGSLIPPGGRSVQCTACDHVWQQLGDGGRAKNPASAPPQSRPSLTNEVREILRHEAEHEARVRRERGLVEIEPEGVPSPPRQWLHAAHGASGPLPDAEAINATLRAASERAQDAQGRLPRPGQRGFVAGLVVGLLIVGLGALVYSTAPRIAAEVPAATPMLERYVEVLDDTRQRLDRAAARLTAAVSGLLSSDV